MAPQQIMTRRAGNQEAAQSLKASRRTSFAKKPTITTPDPIAFAAAAKALG